MLHGSTAMRRDIREQSCMVTRHVPGRGRPPGHPITTVDGPVSIKEDGGDPMKKPGLWLAAAALLAMSTTVSAGESTGYYTTTDG